MDLGQQIITALRPDSLADIFLYLILFGSVAALATIPEKNVLSPYLMYAVILAVIIDLFRGGGDLLGSLGNIRIGGEPILSNRGLLTFILHIIMFALPLMAAGLVRRYGRKQGALAVPMCLLVCLIGGFFAVISFFAPSVVYGRMF
jgi:hypothetical protein